MIPKVRLGESQLRVSKLGFGTFDFGVASLGISPEKGGQMLAEAHRLGVSYWDTSDDYGSHPHVASGLARVRRGHVAIATKTSAKSSEAARRSLQRSLRELRTDYVDLFLLHYVKADWIDGCREVLRELGDLKKKGLVRALGLSTHSVAVVRETSGCAEAEVIMAVCCNADQATILKHRDRIPVDDGTIEEMVDALRLAHRRGRGVVAMKVLGNSTPPLVRDYRASIEAIARLDSVHALVIGMKSLGEIRKNVAVIASA